MCRNWSLSCCFLFLFLILLCVVIIFVCIFLLIVHPKVVNFSVTNATLTELNYTNNTLHYNLALNITISNPDKNVDIYYDYVEALALYKDVNYASKGLGTFFMRHKSTRVLSLDFKGLMPLSTYQISKMKLNNSFSVYHVNVVLYSKVRFKTGLIKSPKMKQKVHCDFMVPLESPNGTKLANRFEAIDCDMDYIKM